MSIKNKMLIYLTVLMFGMLGYFGEAVMVVGNEQKLEQLKIQKEELKEKTEKLEQELEDIEFSKEMVTTEESSVVEKQVMEISLVEKQIREISKEMNFNPDTAVRIAMCESSLCPTAKNKTSSATGIFQFMTGTWNAYCAGDRLSVEDSTRCFIKLYPKYSHWWVCS